MKTAALLVLLPCLCAAADAPPSLDAVSEMARAAPGEFAADALIRLAALNSIEKARRIQLLEQAFRRAAESQEPLKRQSAMIKVAGAAGFLTRAFSQDLDALSLRLRVVEAMEALDPERARTLFRQIGPLRVPKLSCADFMVYNVAAYYRMLARLAPPALVLERVGAITSPVQIAPAAGAILNAGSDADFRAQLAAFAGALGKISGDDRSFSFVPELGPQILLLVEQAKRRNISPLLLLESYRLYLVNNEETARCSDNDLMRTDGQVTVFLMTGGPAVGGEGVEFFNSKLRMPPLQPIQEQETTPTKLEGVAEGLRPCEDPTCQAIAQQYNELIFDPQTKVAYPVTHRSTPEWQAQLRKMLAAMAEWKQGTATTAAQYYRQKSAVYAETLSLVPAGPLQEEVVKAMLAFAEKSGFLAESRIEWFLPINILVGRMALDPMGPGKFAANLRQSKNPIIALYSALEVVAPRTPDKIMALM